MKTVELKTAYHWHCVSCSEENFALPQKAELTDQEAEDAYREFNDLGKFFPLPSDWRNFEMVYIPETVTCSKCSETFTTIDERLV